MKGGGESGQRKLSRMAPDVVVPTLLVIDLIDDQTGLAEIEDDQGRSYAVPADWLPEAADGQAYLAAVSGQGVIFERRHGGAALIREKNKQTLLDFSDEHEGGDQ